MNEQTETHTCTLCHGTKELWEPGETREFAGTGIAVSPARFVGVCPECVSQDDIDKAKVLLRRNDMGWLVDAAERSAS